MKKLLLKLSAIIIAPWFMQTASAAVIQYDFVAEAVGNEGGYSAFTTDGVGNSGVYVTATASNFAGTTSYYAYLDDADVTRPAGLGACMALISGESSGCLIASDDSLNNGVVAGEVLSLTWDQIVTINLITFRNGSHQSVFAAGRDFEVRVDGGAWQNYDLVHLFTTPLTGSRFDFIVDDTFGFDDCTSALCGDGTGPGAALYISNVTIETPEPGMVALFLLGIGLIAFSNRQRLEV